MARNLIIVGLGLIAVAILLELVKAILAIAIPVGALLIIIGIAWFVFERQRHQQS